MEDGANVEFLWMRSNWTNITYKGSNCASVAVIMACTFVFGVSWAATSATEATADNPDNTPSLVDAMHQTVSSSVDQISDSLDTFFSAQRVQKESAGSRVHTYLLTETSREFGFKAHPTASIRLRLPKTEDKLRLFIESGFKNRDDNDDLNALERVTLNQEDGNWFSTAIQYVIFTSKTWNVNTKSGVAFESYVPDPFTTVYARYQFPVAQLNFRVSQEFYYFAIAGGGEETRLEVDRRLTDAFLLRFATTGTWQETQDYFALSQDAILLQRLTPKLALAYSVGVIGHRYSTMHLEAYRAEIRLRRQIWRQWFFFEIKPVVTFPAATQFAADPRFHFNLEAVFGG